MRPDGTLATTPHPARLGSALTHPHITTDFSEAQLELITGVHGSADACLDELTAIHQAVYRAIGDELLWCASMPCRFRRTSHPDRPLRQLQRRPRQDRVSDGPFASLRQAHADDLRHPLQLLVARAASQ